MATAERIDCPNLLPEDPATAHLTEMLVPAPYEVPEKKAKKRATETRKSLRRKVVPDSSSEDTEAHSSNDNEEEEENPLPRIGGGGEEKEGHPFRGGRRVQEGKDPPSGPIHNRRLQRGGVATQGPTPGKVVSIRMP